jgi:Flp pilus assembly protein TadG
MHRSSLSILRPAPGQAVVELAFIITMLVMLGFGVYEFGRALQAQNVMTQAAREGARVGMNFLATDAQIRTAAVNAALPYVVPNVAGSPGIPGVAVTHPATDQTSVTVYYAFQSSIWFVGNITIQAGMVSRRA